MQQVKVVEDALLVGPDPALGEGVDAQGRPDPAWTRGKCPVCGDDVVSNLYYIAGRGYLIRWECWSALRERPSCDYRRVL